MRVPTIQGVIRRRLLVNFRVDPDVVARRLPAPFRPKLQEGYAIAGLCLIRLEQIRPSFLPVPIGLSSENAAHRIAVRCGPSEEAVYIPRRDSDSWLNHAVGGRLFPGEHHRARFEVQDDEDRVELKMTSLDGTVSVHVAGRTASEMPANSVFNSLDQASRFFEAGSLGYSATREKQRFDAIVLETKDWRVTPLAVSSVASSYFDDHGVFPAGSVAFDHALIMRNLRHEWHAAPDLYGEEPADHTFGCKE